MYKNQWTFYLLLMYICNKEIGFLLVMKLTLNLKINFYLILILSIFLSNPVHAYAGPGSHRCNNCIFDCNYYIFCFFLYINF